MAVDYFGTIWFGCGCGEFGNPFGIAGSYGYRELEAHHDLILEPLDKRCRLLICYPSPQISEHLIYTVLLHHRHDSSEILHQFMAECVIEQMIGREKDNMRTYLDRLMDAHSRLDAIRSGFIAGSSDDTSDLITVFEIGGMIMLGMKK